MRTSIEGAPEAARARPLPKEVEAIKAVSRPGSAPYHPWVFGSLALLFLTACATAPRSAEQARPSGDEPVDIGYGTVDKGHLTGSVATVQREGQQVHFRTLAEMLLRVPGIQVIERAGDMSVRIRGTNTSFLANQEPLFVIDGVLLQSGVGGLSGINPNDVESITVLKDPGETAIYGMRGANGVILIKTRKGSK